MLLFIACLEAQCKPEVEVRGLRSCLGETVYPVPRGWPPLPGDWSSFPPQPRQRQTPPALPTIKYHHPRPASSFSSLLLLTFTINLQIKTQVPSSLALSLLCSSILHSDNTNFNTNFVLIQTLFTAGSHQKKPPPENSHIVDGVDFQYHLSSSIAFSFAMADRYMPLRTVDDAIQNLKLSSASGSSSKEEAAFQSSLASACDLKPQSRILAFKPQPPEPSKPLPLRSQYNRPEPVKPVAAQLRRRILTAPERVLDAPSILDDYYLNVLDWSCHNQVAIGLGQTVYVWSADSGQVSSLFETSADQYVSSLKWSHDGAYVSVGLSTGEIQIWDVEDQAKVRSMFGHEYRVSVMGMSTIKSFRHQLIVFQAGTSTF
jgi:hypothetical protein